MKKALILSFLAHSLLFSPLLLSLIPGCGGGKGTGSPPDERSQRQIIEKKKAEEPIEVGLINLPKKAKPAKSQKDHSKDECDYFFGGIGIEHSGLDGKVDKVYAGYPAEAAGIQVGDALVDYSHIIGEIGTEVSVTLTRDGQTITKTMIRDKICMSPRKEIPNGPSSP